MKLRVWHMFVLYVICMAVLGGITFSAIKQVAHEFQPGIHKVSDWLTKP